jgi:hypothetical protein
MRKKIPRMVDQLARWKEIDTLATEARTTWIAETAERDRAGVISDFDRDQPARAKRIEALVKARMPELLRLRDQFRAEWQPEEKLGRDTQPKRWRIYRGKHGDVRLELGRLWLVRCAPQHPHRWMIIWRAARDCRRSPPPVDYEPSAEVTAWREANKHLRA